MTPTELTTIRKATGLTQAGFARWLGYDNPRTYGRYERGNRPVPMLLALIMRYVEKHGILERKE